MDTVLNVVCVGGFLLLPLAVLGLRAVQPKRLPWWAAFLIVVTLGWPLVLGAAILNETPDHGAARVFALFFGWAYALAWFIPWLLVYGVLQLFRRLYAKRAD